MTARPAFRVTLDGRDLSDRLRPRLVSLSLTEKRGADADQLELTLADADGRLAIPPIGAVLQLALGWDAAPTGQATGLTDKGRYKVDEVEHSGSPDQLVIRARAADFTGAARVRRLRSWTGRTLGAIVADIAAGSGLAAQVAPALAGVAVPVFEQGRLSDMAALKKLGSRYDAVATVKAGKLLFLPIGAGQTAGGQALPSATIRRVDGDRHSYRRAARDSYPGVTASWHDPKAAERRFVSVGETTGAKALQRTYGSEADARAAAQAAHNRQKRGEATLSLALAHARPTLYPEQRVRVQGFKPEIDATAWLIAEVRHELGDQGFTTGLSLETAL